ncbi:MAG: PilZ domain-containing protein [Pseudomonadota bacterium]|nr:PilZ domain-containing protein [Pseudomonadota bacterium]
MHGVRSAILSGEGVHPATPVAAVKKKKSDPAARTSLTAIAVKREESRLTNQRREDRHRDIFEEATIHFRRRKYQVPVINSSASGVMIEADIEPRIGEALQIQFNQCNRTQCVVRWVRGNRIGLEFNEETTIIGPSSIQDFIIRKLRGGDDESDDVTGAKASRTPRHSLIWIGTVHCEHQTMPVRLRNISTDGAMLETEHQFAAGAEILLDLEEAGTAFAKVRWAKGGQIGIKFDQRFNLKNLTRCRTAATEILSSTGKSTTYMLKPRYLESETSPDSPWAAMWERLTPQDLSSKQK